jgi:DNA-directed RNA polymerase specialized sigma24 family protein
MDEDDPVTRWIEGLRAGDEAAVTALWDRYFAQLVHLARQKLADTPRRVADEEDVAVSVFRCLCSGAQHGRLADMADRGDLWRVLVTMTIRKVIDQQRRLGGKKRGAGRVRGESVFFRKSADEPSPGLQQFSDHLPTPLMLTTIEEEGQRLLAALTDPRLRQIALWRLEGYTNDEIAAKLELTTRSVERKLQRIRDIWSQVIDT